MNPDQPTSPPLVSQSVEKSDTLQLFIPTKNIPALISYYCGVFGLIPLLGLPLSIAAIIFGKIGLSKYKTNPTPGAKAHALVGLVLGVFELVVFAAFIALVILANQR